MYSAILLDDQSQAKLKAWAVSEKADIRINHIRLPIHVRDNGWKLICHHMTIQYPGTPDYIKPLVDTEKKVALEATHIGISDKAVAVRVVGFPSKNKIPHITVAIGPDGKAKDSNEIKNWERLAIPLKLNGNVKELQ